MRKEEDGKERRGHRTRPRRQFYRASKPDERGVNRAEGGGRGGTVYREGKSGVPAAVVVDIMREE